MKCTTALLAFAATASAANLRGYFETNCGGGYAECGNVGAGTCCVLLNGNAGSPSVAVVFTNPSTQLFGYQRTRDGNNCGSIASQLSTGALSYSCMSINPALGTYAAARWYPPGLIKRSETCSPESTEECTGFVTPDTIVTNDGRSFNLEGVDDATKTEFYELAASGKEVPKKFASLEQDVEGIAERVKKMTV